MVKMIILKNQILNIINICKTYNTCIEYSKVLKNEYDELNIKKRNII